MKKLNKICRSLDKLDSEELCSEAARVRNSIELEAEYLNSIYVCLHAGVRDSIHDESYLLVANMGKRISNLILQASRRASVFEARVIKSVKQRLMDQEYLKEEERKRKDRKSKIVEGSSGIILGKLSVDSDSIDELYGKEIS